MKTLQLVLVLAVVSTFTKAGTGDGKVSQITAHSENGNGEGVVMFQTEVNSNKPACSSAFNGSHWTFSLEKESGKAMYSLLLTAYAQQKSVSVVGYDNCNIWPDRESVRYLYIDD